MTCQLFIQRSFAPSSLEVIDRANAIITDYQEQGFTLTLRQLYYQFVARGLLPNQQSEYKRLGSILNDARLAGMIDWEAIEDRTRNLQRLTTWATPQSIAEAAAEGYREDIWINQPRYIEVWVEKEALVGVIEPVCNEFRVPFFACRGYSSQSEQWRAGRRFVDRASDYRQRTLILHLGDHDPSGIDMSRDNADRLRLFSDVDEGSIVDLKRLALNMAQVEELSPPPNPAKETDSRHSGYAAKYGDESWELDALDPTYIDALIRKEIAAVIDPKKWAKAIAKEERGKKRLRTLATKLGDE